MEERAIDSHLDAWRPSADRIERANITTLMREVGAQDVPALHRWSVQHQEAFVSIALKRLAIRFRTEPSRILDLSSSSKSASWLVNAKLNIVDSCFNAPKNHSAIVFSHPNGTIQRWSYGELRSLSNRVSNGIVAAGFTPGDPIAMYMPMTPLSVAIYLGIIQARCVVVSIAESFAPDEIARRLRISAAKAIITTTHMTRGGKRLGLYERIVSANAPRAIVLPEVENGHVDTVLRDGDLSWQDFIHDRTMFDPIPSNPIDSINILFSSGTTGDPKAIPFEHATPIKCAMDGHYHHDLHAGDVVAWPTSLGWMMGPWLVFATLINRGTIALHHDAPTDRAFGEFVRDARVNMLGVVPSLVRRWRETGCMAGLDWQAIQTFSSTGECSNRDDMRFLMQLAGGKPIIEYCGGTEIGGAFMTSTVIQPNIPGTFSTPALGSDLILLDDNDRPADLGELYLVPPALGLSSRLLNADHEQIYFAEVPAGPTGEVLRRHGDQFQRLPNGYYQALGRVDDTMKLGGIKVSSAEIERATCDVAGITEAAAIAIKPREGGPSMLVMFVVSSERVPQDELRQRLQHAINDRLNPLFRIHDVATVDELPRTATQKIRRRALRESYEFARQENPEAISRQGNQH